MPFRQRCEKDGCTEGSMEKYFAAAKEILSADQYAQLKAECGKMEKHGQDRKPSEPNDSSSKPGGELTLDRRGKFDPAEVARFDPHRFARLPASTSR